MIVHNRLYVHLLGILSVCPGPNYYSPTIGTFSSVSGSFGVLVLDDVVSYGPDKDGHDPETPTSVEPRRVNVQYTH